MIECEGCHRYIHATESSCPFCAAAIAPSSGLLSSSSVAGLATGPIVAFAAGLSLLACTDSDDDAGTSTTGETLDYSGADYGGPPPCDELATAIPIAVGSNPIDTSMGGDDFITSCGDQSGTGSDLLLEFVAPASGHFTFALTNTNFDAWLLYSSYYCDAYGEAECMPNQGYEIDLIEGETLYLILDGSAGSGTGSVDVTQD